MQLETINKLYLELSQFTSVKTSKDLLLESQLTDGRFWSIIKTLKEQNQKNSAIYLVRLITRKGLSEAKEYVENIDYYREKVSNPLQISI